MAGIEDYQNYRKFKDLREDGSAAWEPAFPEGPIASRSIRPKELELKPRTPRRSPDEDEGKVVFSTTIDTDLGTTSPLHCNSTACHRLWCFIMQLLLVRLICHYH